MASRSREKAEAAIKQLKDETGKGAIFLQLDLGSMAAAKKAAAERSCGHISSSRSCPRLLSSPPHGRSPDRRARVVATSSSMAMLGKIDFDALRDVGRAGRKRQPHRLYFQSKLVLVTVRHDAARCDVKMTSAGHSVLGERARCEADSKAAWRGEQGIVSLAVDPGKCLSVVADACGSTNSPVSAVPGTVEPDLHRHLDAGRGNFRKNLSDAVHKTYQRPTLFGALTQLWAGTRPEGLQYNGEHVVPVGKIAKCRAEAYDDDLGERLVDIPGGTSKAGTVPWGGKF
ncbi:hypothetical protein DAEQUDRAFT_767595 [Daedalea quercina L-15889]|uniref:Uncharacterized protein n=1 Tax=Daedalea quercina L-15889 TaxID=1314783 RepID=A0A165NFT4_9APHY|nr:hypothetical protein DAEQUDRAFT_767595 [Daedalea quercina L-15889]